MKCVKTVFWTVLKLQREYGNQIKSYNLGKIETNGGTVTVYRSLPFGALSECLQLFVHFIITKNPTWSLCLPIRNVDRFRDI